MRKHEPDSVFAVSDPDLSGPDRQHLVKFHQLPQLPLKPVHLGCHLVEPVWHRKLICDPHWRIYITDRPGVGLIHDGHEMPYRPDRLMVIPGWVPFTFLADTAVVHAYIHFLTPRLPGALVRRHFPTPMLIDRPDLLALMRRWAKTLHGLPTPTPWAVAQAHGLAHLIMAEMLIDRPSPLEDDPGAERLQPALDHLTAHLHEPVAVRDLARILSVSQTHCIRLFRRHLGQTPMDCLIEQRVVRAAELLLDSDRGIDDIARACGFPNRAYLSRMFTRRMGQPPARYRQEHRRGSG